MSLFAFYFVSHTICRYRHIWIKYGSNIFQMVLILIQPVIYRNCVIFQFMHCMLR
uniref:Uncharacterized protein n=1 Tax=Anguilla anguilla TaxID=7936 RepID=A0A0E9S885_ANGAN